MYSTCAHRVYRPCECTTATDACYGAAAQNMRRGKRDMVAFQDMMRGLLA